MQVDYEEIRKASNIKKLYCSACKNGDIKIILGSVYSMDPQIPISWINNLYVTSKTKPNDIVILHDRTWTIKTMKNLKKWLDDNNYKSITVKTGLDKES